MKSILSFLAIVMASLIFVSCGKKNDSDNSTAIIGKWTAVKQYDKSYVAGQLISSDTFAIVAPDYATFEFKTGNVFKSDYSVQGEEDHVTGYYKLQGSQIFVGDSEADPEKEIYTYQLTGNSLSMSISYSDTVNSVIYKDEVKIDLKK